MTENAGSMIHAGRPSPHGKGVFPCANASAHPLLTAVESIPCVGAWIGGVGGAGVTETCPAGSPDAGAC
jgi:hypothetical protein